MECSYRFTAAEGGARLASTARSKNTLAAPPPEHAAFVAIRLLHEKAYMIRGSLFEGSQRSVYITRASRVPCVAYDIRTLTDLSVCPAVLHSDVYDWCAELDKKEVLVCTSEVLKKLLEDEAIGIPNLNVLIIDSCHLISEDDDLKYIMNLYRQCADNKPRILALTYPLFSQYKDNTSIEDSQGNVHANMLENAAVNIEEKRVVKYVNSEKDIENVSDKVHDTSKFNTGINNESRDKAIKEIGLYKNLDDFVMYEKLEWKIDVLEEQLCCEADLAEDIDGVKRLSTSLGKPKEQIIEYSKLADERISHDAYLQLEKYMRSTIMDALDFLNEHRYDPTEIYGEELYEEIKNIPDPTLDPKYIFHQFLYVLDELGPYGADKAAFSLLIKLEKLKIKIPYERHFLLLCLCTSVFVKIRCAASLVFQNRENDWRVIRRFSTPKLLRFFEILEKFKPPPELKTDAKSDVTDSDRLLKEIDSCDFVTLSNRIEDAVNVIEGNLKEIEDLPTVDHDSIMDRLLQVIDREKKAKPNDDCAVPKTEFDDKSQTAQDEMKIENTDESKDGQKGILGFHRRMHRTKGRGRMPRNNAARTQNLQNPDALCSIVFMKEPLMAKILFMIVVELSRHHPNFGFLCAQYCAIENPADPVKEPRDFEQQRRRQEEVLKKFRMHECNLLLATSALEEGIDLPRCNLVLRWDLPASYRSYGLCRSRARAHRSACVLLTHSGGDATRQLLHHVATYRELDQIVSRKCGCGAPNEPPQSEESEADGFNALIKPYSPLDRNVDTTRDSGRCESRPVAVDACGGSIDSGRIDPEGIDSGTIDPGAIDSGTIDPGTIDPGRIDSGRIDSGTIDSGTIDPGTIDPGRIDSGTIDSGTIDSERIAQRSAVKRDLDVDCGASVDLSSAIALINRYCGKLPSDTFTRLAPQWWMEEVTLPVRRSPGRSARAFVCTLRLPLNCPVKYNIVGHPMPTRALARRMVALQACRILHRSGELDNQLMPIGKENFKAPEFEYAPAPPGDHANGAQADNGDMARPGTTKRRQYYYKRTACAFTDCQPITDTSDPGTVENEAKDREYKKPIETGEPSIEGKHNVLYAICCKLWCALPERYNTRGRRLHAPQHAKQALAIFMARTSDADLQIPAFPVYTRSGEVRVSVERVQDADVRVTPHRGRLIRRFMRFVFAEVLRVRRRGMRLQSEGSTHNNYYIVPTVKTTNEDGTTKIDIDWAFLELIYQHTEQKKNSEVEKPLFWHQEEEEEEGGKVEEGGKKNDDDKEVLKKHDKVDGSGVNNDGVNSREIIEKLSNVHIENEITGNEQTIENSELKCAENHSVVNTDSLNTEGATKTDENEVVAEKSVEIKETKDESKPRDSKEKSEDKKTAKKLDNPLLKPGEVFVFDAEKYREAVVTPWYRNQDQPQFFLVAEICWSLTPDSAFPSSTHTTFSSYYGDKYGVGLTQRDQPLLDVDHTSARLNLLTPRYVNRKGVALPVSSERTRRAKRDRLDQKQILVPELCRVHPFAAPLWFATVALPCVLYRINALLIADEIRRAVAIDVGLGIPRIDERSCPGFQWPPLDFGWSLAEVLNVNDADKPDRKREEAIKEIEETTKREETRDREPQKEREGQTDAIGQEKTLNDILQEKEDAEGGFEIGTWSNDMASSIPNPTEYNEYTEPLPPNLTFCTTASGGTNWCDPVKKPTSNFIPTRAFSMADSDCSYMSSDFDTDDSDFNSEGSDDDTDVDGFCSSKNSNAAMGVRIEYKTAHEAEAVDVKREKKVMSAPQPDPEDDARDRGAQDRYLRHGDAPQQYIDKFHQSIDNHKAEIIDKKLLIKQNDIIIDILPDTDREQSSIDAKSISGPDRELIDQMFPYGTSDSEITIENGKISIEKIEKNKRVLLAELKRNLSAEDARKLNFYSMTDVDIDSKDYVNEKVANVGFDDKKAYVRKLNVAAKENDAYVEGYRVENGKEFDFDYQPALEGHPGPSPSVILQGLTMSNANDGINLERLETIGDSFLKFAITAYLYCAHPTVHEGKLSHMRSKQVSNLNLYRLGRNKRLGARMIASKFEPHDNWLPPCHRPPATLARPNYEPSLDPNRSQCPVHGVPGGGREGAGGEAPAFDDCRCRQQDCYIPYNLITQHSIPDKSIADCVEALIGAYLIDCGPRGALLFMSWLGIKVLPRHEVVLTPDHPYVEAFEVAEREDDADDDREVNTREERPKRNQTSDIDSDCSSAEDEIYDQCGPELEDSQVSEDWSWPGRAVGSLRPYRNEKGEWVQAVFGELNSPPSPLLRYIEDPEAELEQMLSGYEELEKTLQYRFKDRSLLLQALTHASHHQNRLTDCYQRLEFLGDAILDYLITRHLYEDERRHSPGALTDLRSALVNNTIFATLAVRHGFHKYFRHMSPGLNEVLTRYVKIQDENGHSISEEHYLIQEDEMEQAEDVEVPKALGDLFESVAGAIFLDSGMSLGAVWRSYVNLMGAELEAFSAAAPKSPVRELLEAEPDTAKFGKPERLADGRRVRVSVEVFGRGTFKGVGRNYRIAKGTAARCALRHLKHQH